MKSHAISTLLALFVAWIVYDLVWDTYPPLIVEDHFTIGNDQPIPRNDTLKVFYHVTVERACPGTGRRIFVDAGNVPQPTVSVATDTGERADGQQTIIGDSFDAIVEAPVPQGMAPGGATYQNQSVYYCNLWQRLTKRGISVAFPLVSFTVGERALPEVKPATAIFKRTERTGLEAWLINRVAWFRMGDE